MIFVINIFKFLDLKNNTEEVCACNLIFCTLDSNLFIKTIEANGGLSLFDIWINKCAGRKIRGKLIDIFILFMNKYIST